MKNILLISTIYPIPEGNRGTAVCHYFTREWVKMGYNVKAVHVQAVYPHPFYWIAKFNAKRIAAKTGAVVYTKRLNHVEHYMMDEVPVMRIPVFKPIPHGKFASWSIREAVKTVVNNCNNEGFSPDVIIGHFPNPQIEILSLLKEVYPNARNCIVMHGDTEIMRNVYGQRLPALMKDIDMWGFRCKTMIDNFEAVAGKVDNPFICYSGIPAKYITQKNTHDYNGPLHRFLYVGEMIERKYPEKIIDALMNVYPTKEFELRFVGDGQQLSAVKNKIEGYGIQNQVKLLGWIPRDKIIDEYDQADCMIMISKGEAYGLVYLEAMARGCIPIASKREGFDGIIVDGVNGFLCEAGDDNELASIINRINHMETDERMKISENAISKAKELTDEKAAKLYLDDVIERI